MLNAASNDSLSCSKQCKHGFAPFHQPVRGEAVVSLDCLQNSDHWFSSGEGCCKLRFSACGRGTLSIHISTWWVALFSLSCYPSHAHLWLGLSYRSDRSRTWAGGQRRRLLIKLNKEHRTSAEQSRSSCPASHRGDRSGTLRCEDAYLFPPTTYGHGHVPLWHSTRLAGIHTFCKYKPSQVHDLHVYLRLLSIRRHFGTPPCMNTRAFLAGTRLLCAPTRVKVDPSQPMFAFLTPNDHSMSGGQRLPRLSNSKCTAGLYI